MGYAEGSYRRPIWIPIVVGLVMFFVFFRPGGCSSNRVSSIEEVEQTLLTHPEAGPIYQAIQRTYPDEFHALIVEEAAEGPERKRLLKRLRAS